MITERSWVNIFKISLEVLTVSKSSTGKERERDRERQFPIQTCCLRANGSIIMIDRPESLSSGTLNGIGTDQYLHWRWSHILFHQGSAITEAEIHSSDGCCLRLTPNWVSESPMKSCHRSPYIILPNLTFQQCRRITRLLQF